MLKAIKIIAIFLFVQVSFAQSPLIMIYSDNGLSPYPKTDDLVAGYNENEMTISNWQDQVGTKDFLQAVAGGQPSLITNALNNYPALRFDGTSDYMAYASDLVLAQPITIYFVAKIISWTDGDVLLRSNATLQPLIAEGGGGTNIYMYAGNYAPIRSYGTGTYKIASCVFNGASSVFQVNTDVATGNSGTGGFNADLFLGSNDTGTANANIEIVCLYIHSTAHDLTTRTQIINWLNSKYKIY